MIINISQSFSLPDLIALYVDNVYSSCPMAIVVLVLCICSEVKSIKQNYNKYSTMCQLMIQYAIFAYMI